MQQDVQASFAQVSNRLPDAELFIRAGRANGASLLVELTSLNPHSGQPALMHIRNALQVGMDVITANKGPVAYAQSALEMVARHHSVQFRFESTVMDGLPLINLAQFTLQAVGITAFRALLNATSGVVLHMIEEGHSLEKAIWQAQQLGIAEADPWYDLDGWDAAMKTTILANNLLGGSITPQQVKRTGIRDLDLDDIRAAAMAGTPIRLLSSARIADGSIRAEIRPDFLSHDDVLHVNSSTGSVISLETEALGAITLVEHNPTVLSTAYGVLSDLITILRNRTA